VESKRAIRLALREARKASGRAFPNPPVGAVLFRGEKILGRGHTQPVGGAHAEIVALERARQRFGADSIRGASMAVTLEPCSYRGRTGPCADALIEAGLGRVIVGHLDPHPRVSGEGIRRLQVAGIEVEIGVCEADCREQHRGFLSVLERGRPFVELKLASSMDGRIATATGASRWITGERARAEVQRMRARSDAIAVGSGTAAADNPELVARRNGRVIHRPVRVVFSSSLALPLDLGLFSEQRAGKTWIVCAETAPEDAVRHLDERGVSVLQVPVNSEGKIDLAEALRGLAEKGLTQVLLEGGGMLAASFLREGLVDALSWFVAPLLLGGDGRAALGSLGVRELSDALQIQGLQVRKLGPDLYLRGSIGAGRKTG